MVGYMVGSLKALAYALLLQLAQGSKSKCLGIGVRLQGRYVGGPRYVLIFINLRFVSLITGRCSSLLVAGLWISAC